MICVSCRRQKNVFHISTILLLSIIVVVWSGAAEGFSATPTKTPKTSASTGSTSDGLPTKMAVVIAGGGPGGLSTCIALRNRGIDAHVLEAAPKLLRGSTGTGIMISPNGFSALDAIDPSLTADMQNSGATITKQTIRISPNATWEEFKTMSFGGLAEQYGIDQTNIGWAKAHEILASRVPENVIHCGCKVVSYRPSKDEETGEDCVLVSLEDGRTVQTSLLVGADGFGSNIRKMLMGDKLSQTRFNGQLLWNAIVPTKNFLKPVHKEGEVEFSLTRDTDGQAMLAFDTGDGNTAWYMTLKEEKAPETIVKALQDGEFGGFDGQWGAKTALQEAFKDWPMALECLKATPENKIFERRQADKPKLMRWSSRKEKGANGRVVLMGDAAHPMIPSLGQGTMVTFEDAAELAACIAPSSNDGHDFDGSKIPKAIRKFVKRRAKRCAMVQETSSDRYMGKRPSRFYPKFIITMMRTMRKTNEMYSYKS